MKSNLPKEGWFVRDDGSKKFKENVFNDVRDISYKCCGQNSDGTFLCSDFPRRTFGEVAKELTIDEYIQIVKPIEPSITDTKGFVDLESYLHKDTVCVMLEDLTNKFPVYNTSRRVDILTEFLDNHGLPYVQEEVKDFAKTGALTNIKAGDGEIAHTREDKVDEMYTYFTKNCK